jgi:hypothetical protein
MTDTITLPRAVGLNIRNSLRGIVNASDDDCGEEKCRECAPVRVMREALAALDAALAEPPAKRKPATDEQVIEAYAESTGNLLSRWEYFHKGWREAERFHGITKEDK